MSNRDIPAFPALDNFEGELSMRQEGMALRDYFAAKAMMGDWSAKFNEANWLEPGSEDEVLSKSAALYYRMADAMLEARKAGKEAA